MLKKDRLNSGIEMETDPPIISTMLVRWEKLFNNI